MRKEISAAELHQKLGELLDGVYHNGDRLIVKRANTPLAAIVPIEAYEEMLQQREQAFSVLDKIWEKVPAVSEEEAHADIERAIAEVRTEKIRKKSKLSS
ncbi:MAG: type II toxin-antitoxin system prevent-host-death family antitoxin [Candidatus Poribacteria bacterium]|nr:type II toxin-antitoxin system prevent-host-death family antitoxin [Candidatus Poribacteria bacterium]